MKNTDDYETQERLSRESSRVVREHWQAQDRKLLYANNSYPHNEDNLLKISDLMHQVQINKKNER